jgi:16S rRNA (uracil1498-N3)-methyltransferase
MNLPLFFIDDYKPGEKLIQLDEDRSKHIVSVLRMEKGEPLMLTDGKGSLLICEIEDDHRKRCVVRVTESQFKNKEGRKVIVAISLLKNASRFEWFIEKATELGISEIIPLICERTEKQKFKVERIQNILVSAMLQSQQCWLPLLHDPIKFSDLSANKFDGFQKFIAHCDEGNKTQLTNKLINQLTSSVILIGPEGDFTPSEIETSLENGFLPVSLGETRLRTETAAVAASTLLMLS